MHYCACTLKKGPGSAKLCRKATISRKDHAIANTESGTPATKNSSKKGKGKRCSRDDCDQDSCDEFDLPSTSSILGKGHTKV